MKIAVFILILGWGFTIYMYYRELKRNAVQYMLLVACREVLILSQKSLEAAHAQLTKYEQVSTSAGTSDNLELEVSAPPPGRDV